MLTCSVMQLTLPLSFFPFAFHSFPHGSRSVFAILFFLTLISKMNLKAATCQSIVLRHVSLAFFPSPEIYIQIATQCSDDETTSKEGNTRSNGWRRIKDKKELYENFPSWTFWHRLRWHWRGSQFSVNTKNVHFSNTLIRVISLLFFILST